MLDWKNVDDYSFMANLDGHGWAWEFLRRNQQYEKDYATYTKQMNEEIEKYGPYPSRIFLNKIPSEHLYYFSPPKIENESVNSWFQGNLHNKQVPRFFRPDQWCAYKWKIRSALPDPHDYKSCPKFYVPEKAEQIHFDNVDKFFTDEFPKEDKLLIAFDLTERLDPQLKYVSDLFTHFQQPFMKNGLVKNLPKPHVKKWPNYLRAWDAKQCGFTYSEIAEVLEPLKDPENSIQNMQKWVNKAREYIEKDYHDCIYIK